MKKLPDGTIIASEDYEIAVLSEIENLLGEKKPGGQYADWEMAVTCSENGSLIKTRVLHIDRGTKMKIRRYN